MNKTLEELSRIYVPIYPIPEEEDEVTHYSRQLHFFNFSARYICFVAACGSAVATPFYEIEAVGTLFKRVARFALSIFSFLRDAESFKKNLSFQTIRLIDAATNATILPFVRSWIVVRFAFGAVVHPRSTGYLPFLNYTILFPRLSTSPPTPRKTAETEE